VLLTEQLSYAFPDPYAIGFLTGLSAIVEQHQHRFDATVTSRGRAECDRGTACHIDALATLGLAESHPAIRVSI
jgi:hypothetical protein